LKNLAQSNGLRQRLVVNFCFGLTLSLGLLGFSLSQPDVATASGSKDDPDQRDTSIIGLASDALPCLAIGDHLQANVSGVVRLIWQGQAEGARLVLSVAGTRVAHTIKVNGQPAALAPVRPEGQPCSADEYFYLDISPELLVRGDNLIEITDDALPGESWTAANVRLQVFGDVAMPIVLADGRTAAATPIFTFTNPYDGSIQEAIAQIPSGYDPGTPTPLLIAVHARSGTKETGLDWFDEVANARGWLLASPELHGSWPIPDDCYEHPPGPDCQYEDEVLLTKPGAYAYASLESQYDVIGTADYMLRYYKVNASRIYLAGYSMGGQGSVIIAAKFPHLFAAVFDNKGPTDMAEWYDEQVTYYGSSANHNVRAMRKECHIGGNPKTPAQNPFCYQRRSGIRFASNYLHMPISMTHSISDALVPIHHSRDLRDAINSYGPDQSASLYEDTIVGPTCPPGYHCYEPDPEAVLNFLEPFTLNNNPTHINITTDESKSYYWMNLVQSGGDHWSQVEVTYDPISTTVTAFILDSQPLTVGFNLGSTSTTGIIDQPGMGLPATTYLVKGGGSNFLHNYTTGYMTTSVTSVGQFILNISSIDAQLSAYPTMVSAWHTATSTIMAVMQDRLKNPVPDGTTVVFSATEGAFPNESSTYTTTATDGQATTTLSLAAVAADRAEITARVESITGSTSVEIIHPALDVTVTPHRTTIYSGKVISYTYRITNTGDTPLTTVKVVDDNGTPGDNGDDVTVCSGTVLDTEVTHDCTRGTVLTQTTTSTAIVSAQDLLSNNVVDSDSTTVTVISPGIDVTVTPNRTTIYSGEVVTYTYRITNTGDTPLTTVKVVDDNGTPGDNGDDVTVCSGIVLDTEVTHDCTRRTVLTQTTTSTAIVSAQDPLDNDVTDSDSVTVNATFRIFLPLVIRHD
jgi:dienelactone hydrolase